MPTKLTRAYLKLKAGVSVPKSVVIGAAAVNAANELGLNWDCVVTSGNDSTHMRGSKHYSDSALDIRSKTLTKEDKRAWIAVLKRRLGKDYQVILESEGGAQEHVHAEWDPPTPS